MINPANLIPVCAKPKPTPKGSKISNQSAKVSTAVSNRSKPAETKSHSPLYKVSVNESFKNFFEEYDIKSRGRFTQLLNELAPWGFIDQPLIYTMFLYLSTHLSKAYSANKYLIDHHQQLESNFNKLISKVRAACSLIIEMPHEKIEEVRSSIGEILKASCELKKEITIKLANGSKFSAHSSKLYQIKIENITKVTNVLSFMTQLLFQSPQTLMLCLDMILDIPTEFFNQKGRLPSICLQILEFMKIEIKAQISEADEDSQWNDEQLSKVLDDLERLSPMVDKEELSFKEIKLLKAHSDDFMRFIMPHSVKAGKLAIEGSLGAVLPNICFLVSTMCATITYWERSYIFANFPLRSDLLEGVLSQLNFLDGIKSSLSSKTLFNDLTMFPQSEQFVYSIDYCLNQIVDFFDSSLFFSVKKNFGNREDLTPLSFSRSIYQIYILQNYIRSFWVALKNEINRANNYLSDPSSDLDSAQATYYKKIENHSPYLVFMFFFFLKEPHDKLEQYLNEILKIETVAKLTPPISNNSKKKNRPRNRKRKQNKTVKNSMPSAASAEDVETNSPRTNTLLETLQAKMSSQAKDDPIPLIVDKPASVQLKPLQKIMEPVKRKEENKSVLMAEIKSSKQRKFRNMSKLVAQYGWNLHHVTGDHHIYTNNKGTSISVPRHSVLALGTARAIAKQLLEG